jgi:hypothetical protein
METRTHDLNTKIHGCSEQLTVNVARVIDVEVEFSTCFLESFSGASKIGGVRLVVIP